MVRVIVERHCKPRHEAELERLLVELRINAMRQRGYISGETLRSVDDPDHWLVISTWADIDLWTVWKTSQERRNITDKIAPLLSTPEKVSIFAFMKRGGGESAHAIDA
jgi:quinol monooxygenase YgiN